LDQAQVPATKDLSVNRSNFPPTDDGSSEMNQRFVAFRELLIPDEELPEPIEPGMGRLHHPASVFRGTSASALLSCDPWCIASCADLLANGFAVIPLIRIQEPLPFVRKGNDDGIEHGSKLTDVMSVRPGNDQRQRDATAVHQKVPLAPLFSPDLWDSGQSLLAPEAP